MRPFETVVKTVLNAINLPSMVVVVEFTTLGLKLTNWPRDLTVSGKVYTGAAGTHKFRLEFEGLGENLDFEIPSATLTIKCLDGYFQGLFHADSFRGDRVTITLLYIDASGSLQPTGWTGTYGCDADECDANHVTLRLAASDAIHGTELPRRTTQEDGCQHDFMKGGCYFVFRKGNHSPQLNVCDKGYDTPLGCKAHFPDVIDPNNGKTVAQPKPYGGFLGGVDHSLIRR